MKVVGGYEMKEKIIGCYSIRLYDISKKKLIRIQPLCFENKFRVERKMFEIRLAACAMADRYDFDKSELEIITDVLKDGTIVFEPVTEKELEEFRKW
ncbi:MAG: hypothetical protein K2M46_10625 [Lachnospiraceae bacterium]|nr:hypothetical protein [Lachnospiraceae bacterium]